MSLGLFSGAVLFFLETLDLGCLAKSLLLFLFFLRKVNESGLVFFHGESNCPCPGINFAGASI